MYNKTFEGENFHGSSLKLFIVGKTLRIFDVATHGVPSRAGTKVKTGPLKKVFEVLVSHTVF